MLVSVCVITYNHQQYIEQCLNSIVAQDVSFDIEVIVGDDCSVDGTREIVKSFANKYPGKFRLILQPVNTGGTQNYIDVHAAANGKYISHIDGDDLALPGKLQAQVDYLEQHPECSIAWHRLLRFNDAEEHLIAQAAALNHSEHDAEIFALSDLLRLGILGGHSSSMYRNGTRTNAAARQPRLDWMFYVENLEHGQGALLPSVLGCYRVGLSASLTSTTAANQTSHCVLASHFQELSTTHKSNRKDIFLGVLSKILGLVKLKDSNFRWYLPALLRTVTWIDPRDLFRLRSQRRTIDKVQWCDMAEFLNKVE